MTTLEIGQKCQVWEVVYGVVVERFHIHRHAQVSQTLLHIALLTPSALYQLYCTEQCNTKPRRAPAHCSALVEERNVEATRARLTQQFLGWALRLC